MSAAPYTSRRGWLKNGNPPGDFRTAKRCGARTRRGTSCQGPGMANGRCWLHGGLSTGPRTVEGLERSRRAVTKHGLYSQAAKVARREARQTQRSLMAIIARMNELLGEPEWVVRAATNRIYWK